MVFYGNLNFYELMKIERRLWTELQEFFVSLVN